MDDIRLYDIDSLDLVTMRQLVWEAMASKWKSDGDYMRTPTYRTYFSDICWSVAHLAVNKGLIQDPRTGGMGTYHNRLSSHGCETISQVLWELVAQGILYVSFPDPNPDPNRSTRSNAFDVTEYGLKVLKAEKPIPHDPDGYLKHLKAEVPDIDDVIFTYISEAVNAYNHRLYLSATTDIGCASEKAFLLLIEAYTNFLPSQKEQEKFRERTDGKFVKRQFEEFQKSFGGQKGRIDKELLDGIEIVLNGVFELLRQSRNSTGHPTGKAMERENVFVSLQVFVTYCKRIYALIHYFQANAVDFGNN